MPCGSKRGAKCPANEAGSTGDDNIHAATDAVCGLIIFWLTVHDDSRMSREQVAKENELETLFDILLECALYG